MDDDAYDSSNGMALDDEEENDTSENESDDDDMDLHDEESQQMTLFIEILERLEKNKYNYDDYISLIDVAHKLNDLDKIRQSYELFSAVYPLSPEIWLKWLKIEDSFSTSECELEDLAKLYQRALNDYWSTDIAIEFSKIIPKLNQKDELWNQILSRYTLSCLDGVKIFEMWRNNFLKDKKSEAEMAEKLVEIYEKELKLPLLNMENSYIEFKLLIEKHKDKYENYDWDTFNRRYNRAKKALEKILPFEQKFKKLDSKQHKERAELFLNYIKECEDCLEDNFLQAIYERMITECCLNPHVWLEYLKFYDLINDDDSTPNEVFPATKLDIVTRAIRNCTWSTELHIEKLRILEKSKNSTKDDYQKAFEQAIAFGFDSPYPLVEIWMEYLTYLRRITNFTNEQEKEVLRKNFNFAWDHLGRAWGVLADQNCEILQFWGRLEYGELNDPLKARELFTSVMESADNCTKSGLWIEFLNMEQNRNIDSARRLYKKAIQSKDLDNIQTLISAWTRFERCYGTLDTLVECQKKCQELMSSLYTRQRTERKRSDGNSKKSGVKRQHVEEKKAVEVLKEEKRMKFNENTKDVDPLKDEYTVFLSNLEYEVTDSEVADIFPNLKITKINLIKTATGRGRGFGYVEFENYDDVEKALRLDRTPLKGRPTFISSCVRDKMKRDKFKFSDSLEPSKIFVKGIDYEATKEELEIYFGRIGKIKDVRIVCHKNGKSKGIAYVEYENEKSASDAVMKLDQKDFQGHPLSVAISAPPPHQSEKELESYFGRIKSDSKKLSMLINTFSGKSKSSRDLQTMKPRMSLIPQSVQKNLLKKTGSTETDENVTKKTNEDFRKLVLNKN